MEDKETEKESLYSNLEKCSTYELLSNINKEDQKVAFAVEKCIPEISSFVDASYSKMKEGGRLFYIGAGTSGRLGILDASECPPTFGVPSDWVNGIIAGGDSAIRKAVEFAEDDLNQAWIDLEKEGIDSQDVLLGITASGTTPYVLGGIKNAVENGIITGGLSCNLNSPLSKLVSYAITPIVGPEFVTGSTRLKAGTAQKMVLNMISTSLMIKLGRVKGNRMVDMQLANNKLLDRGAKMVQNALHLPYDKSMELLRYYGSVRLAIENKHNR
ncbi:MAG: N-acetylmuramic acid 6-phosphate etherase [Flavobacteriia bacterium]|nr:N-acetylmuramic acid 6-phosphate etherase [Flavobacteriia bacterium]